MLSAPLINVNEADNYGNVSNNVAVYAINVDIRAGAAMILLRGFSRPEASFMTSRNQHVVPHPAGWAVKSAGGSKATAVYETQSEAIGRAREIARNQETELLIHGENGQIRARNSYGNDDFPPRG